MSDEKSNEKGENLDDNSLNNQIGEEMVEVSDKGVNTDELPPEELKKLVDENPELKDIDQNVQIEIKDKEEKEMDENELKRKLIEELNEKDKIFDLLVKSNNELKNKIKMSNDKYQKILEKIEEKKNEDTESKLTNQIREMEKEISANNIETEK